MTQLLLAVLRAALSDFVGGNDPPHLPPHPKGYNLGPHIPQAMSNLKYFNA